MTSSADLCFLSAIEQVELFRKRLLSPVEVLDAQVEQVGLVNDAVNAIAFEYFDEARVGARAAEEAYRKGTARPLEGLTIAIKDETNIAGQVTANGSLLLRDNVSTTTDPVAERIMGAGGLVSIRGTAPEFSMAGVCWSRLFGATSTPWSPGITAGGSSGGCAAAIAAGMATLGNATDNGGSIRIPAAFCGTVGVKASYGRIPEIAPYNADSYCHHGVLGRTVADAALMFNVVNGDHPVDPSCNAAPIRAEALPLPLRGVRISWSMNLGFFEIEPDIAARMTELVNCLADAGAIIEEVTLDWDDRVIRTAITHQQAYSDGKLRQKFAGEEQSELLTSYVRYMFERTAVPSAKEIDDADRYAEFMRRSMNDVFDRYDLFLCPTTATTCVPANYDYSRDKMLIGGVEVHPAKGWFLTYPFNTLSEHPVISMPLGLTDNGVPASVQLVARSNDDAAAFTYASSLEHLMPSTFAAGMRPPFAALESQSSARGGP